MTHSFPTLRSSDLDAAVNRETLDGKNPHGWHPEQRITLAQAMRGYTREGAYAGFNETRLGLIAPGLLADLAVWDSDFFAIDSHSLTKRSEEHTSELQSLMRISYAVFCLKQKQHNATKQTIAHSAAPISSRHRLGKP